MRILILGGDGYLGWPTAMHLSRKGHEVAVLDNMIKRRWEAEVGAEPLLSIPTLHHRVRTWRNLTGNSIEVFISDLATNSRGIYNCLEQFQPEAIVHYAEQPSAPFSMLDRASCVETQQNNILGTLNLAFAMSSVCPEAHLVKLGTMGEYGTPNIDIEEGWLDVHHNGRSDRMLYPKKPGSFYHLSKVHDSHNLEFMCRIWGMRVTDLNQGVVYGLSTPETDLDPNLRTSFHYDAVFGTVLNRFLAMSVAGFPLTIYGAGNQTRGYLNINDTLRCVELAILNPAGEGEFRVFNQFTETFSVRDLADKVIEGARQIGIETSTQEITNPRVEAAEHYYQASNSGLMNLGLEPRFLSEDALVAMLESIIPHVDRIDAGSFQPSVRWRQR